ncbi:hypothetical protein [uncultured Pseudacidovorax sp.]|uniref:hypothetical protein n=1 Tax=uncultured Pseudacidovorax sp. TaxID=679313 RepID=UPI0025FBB397|nr:hypothetical protein [uncultured Pseudacidovorax sp.]
MEGFFVLGPLRLCLLVAVFAALPGRIFPARLFFKARMIGISVRSDMLAFQRKLDAFAYQQMPFATARALTALAGQVKVAEQKALPSVFDRPTPFTVNAIGVKPARKDTLTATVFVKDIAASYLQPYETGGANKLNSKALLKPVAGKIPLNQYGNLPKNKLAQLRAKSNVFVGPITTKAGKTMSGVWQRAKPTKAQPAGKLTLLIAFTDAHPARQRLNYHQRAQQIVRANFNAEMRKALADALASARVT